ncbi:hypothetical protein [Paenibacillus thalictri]|uniref:hypothetical protein n=1 Tax=Paenibacillus thalictri TaxID=2527873 RepID=UPI0013EF06E5|nr:hypothetical protein [Paenibacillus thalictri]
MSASFTSITGITSDQEDKPTPPMGSDRRLKPRSGMRRIRSSGKIAGRFFV